MSAAKTPERALADAIAPTNSCNTADAMLERGAQTLTALRTAGWDVTRLPSPTSAETVPGHVERLTRSRARGARLPPGCVCVDRSTPWGNPFVVGVDGDAAECVRLHRLLRGRDVACWCREGQPCHGDTLLELVAIAATTFHEVKP